jgi:hypothetical protein
MTDKITQTKHIRQQLEKLHQQRYIDPKLPKPKRTRFKGLGLNWRDAVILFLALFFVGLYQVQAYTQTDKLSKSTNYQKSSQESIKTDITSKANLV